MAQIGCHTFHWTSITSYLSNSGRLEIAQTMSGRSSPQTTKIYDQRKEVTLDEVERINI